MTATVDFYTSDFSAMLFPLRTNLFLLQNHAPEISEYVYERVLDADCPQDCFLPQQRVYATKPHGHLRRTAKLDPVAEYFLYDVVYRNRGVFRPEVSGSRRSFGYRFMAGKRIPIGTAHAAFRQELSACANEYKHSIQFDIASYFNSMYHHDLINWFAGKEGVTEKDARALSQFFREINSGRSIDFMPHGVYPAKMIGSEFLKLIDLHGPLRSRKIVRFMDDISLFDDDPAVLQSDFHRIQQLLGQYALNVNPSKTAFDESKVAVNETISMVQQALTEIAMEHEPILTASAVEALDTEAVGAKTLEPQQIEVLLALLKHESLEEEDADQILGFLRFHSDSLLEHLPLLLRRFPNLIKHLHSVCREITDRAELATVILAFLRESSSFLEYQLFWIGAITEDYLVGHGCYGDILLRLYDLTSDHKIARAKVLEIPVQGFGFKEIRGEYLKTGQSDWLSWSSAVGTQSLRAAERNYLLSYFRNGSAMNYLVAECVAKCP